MAATGAGRAATEAHRADQARLAAEVAGRSLELWRMMPVDDMHLQTDRWLAGMVPLVREGRLRSQQTATSYLRRLVEAELGSPSDPFTPLQLSRPFEQLVASVEIAGPVRFRTLVGRGMDPQHAWRTSAVSAASTAMRLVVEAGREEVFGQASQDRRAIGFARVTGPEPCAFCAMLASRGPVYKSADTAAGGRWSEADESFKVHDACQCQIEPAYRLDGVWTDQARQYRDAWDEATREARDAGLIGRRTASRDALNAFRRHMERGTSVSPRVARPTWPQRPVGRRIEPGLTQPQLMPASRIPQKVSTQRAWAEQNGWQVTGEGRRLAGFDGSRRIVWELDDYGRWVVTDLAAA